MKRRIQKIVKYELQKHSIIHRTFKILRYTKEGDLQGREMKK
jgi:hypothetical protein